MRLRKKLKRIFREVIGDFSDVQWRDIDHKKVYIALALLVALIIVIVTLIVGAVKGRDEKPSDKHDLHVTEEQVGDETVAKDPEEEAEEAAEVKID